MYNLIHPSSLESEVFIFHDPQKLSISAFKEEFALFFKKWGIQVVFPQGFVLQIHDADAEWKVNDASKLLDGFLDIIN